ncbi:MAG: hypothetical protein IKH49_09350 [Bacteroidales bacterium]|nr:hypothetical protein [Bacteroidales bacterium]
MKKTMMILAVVLVAAVSCDKHTYRHREDTDPVETVLNKPSNWSIQYKGRENFTETDGYVSRVERVSVRCPGADYYILRTISPDDLKDLYKNDLKAFFEEEAKYLREDAYNYKEKVTDYFYVEEVQDYLLDRMRMGNWLMFLVGMDDNGFITGSYAETSVNIPEETPTESYNKWIGEWNIGDGKIIYPISIEKGEANYTYIIRGWETGSSIDEKTGEQMNQEYLEAEYDNNNGNLYFKSQYLGTYTENNVGIDELFLGKINYKGEKQSTYDGIWIITDEGFDLAAAEMNEGISTATVTGCDVNVKLADHLPEVTLPFMYMQYIAAYMNGNNVEYAEYNKNVPEIPLTMDRTRSSINRPAWTPRPSTRASVHHAQVREHRDRLNQTARGAVRAR